MLNFIAENHLVIQIVPIKILFDTGASGTLITKKVAKDTVAWSHLSVSQAMRGMESEKSPYSENDLKEHF